jgi:hypothetical protein
MSLIRNLQDKLSYTIHSLTYDPQAEEYAASKRAAQEAEDAAKKAREQKTAAAKQSAEAAEAAKARQAKEAEERKANSEFRLGRFLSKIFGGFASVILVFFAFAGAIYGSHLATNLNLYRSWPYRVLYAIYGFIFFPIVILYVLGYRWWWNGKKPRYYALLPLIPYYINNPLLAKFFSWLSYKPDDVISALQEWNPAMVKKAKEVQEREEAAEAEEAEEAANTSSNLT